MSNPTTPFSWQMPTATDLVTDLPADFEVFGQAVATSMADLLGGTTGQVLSKTTNADMDFTWVNADDTNAIQNSIMDAKGDLIAATAADTPARLAVGTNGQILTADSTAATGIKWATPAAAASGLTFIQRSTFSNVANTGSTFDGVFTSTYKSYVMVIEEIYAATGGDQLHLQFRAGGVTTTTTYDSSSFRSQIASGTGQTDSNSGAQIILSFSTGSSSYLSNGSFTLTGVGNMADATITGLYYAGSLGASVFVGGTRAGIQFDGFLLKSGSTNISGTVSIYGLAAA